MADLTMGADCGQDLMEFRLIYMTPGMGGLKKGSRGRTVPGAPQTQRSPTPTLDPRVLVAKESSSRVLDSINLGTSRVRADCTAQEGARA